MSSNKTVTTMSHNAVRVVIFRGDKLLVIHRQRDGHEFFVLPGGTIEPGETLEQTAIREAKEETNLDVTIVMKLFTLERIFRDKPEATHFFLVNASDGEPRIIGEELDFMTATNTFVLEWHTLASLKGKNFYPDGVYGELEKRFGKK